jgi:hypothetical protein
MAETSKREKQPATPEGPTADHAVEEQPAVERGERIDTGKTIARGGKTTGPVPGAQEPKR